MYKRVFDIHAWKLSTHAFNEGDIRLYESLTSIGNGYMGMRGNFEEGFSGDSHTGTYIAGIWFPDKTRVGWWKNGYPKYFGKVINAVNFAAIGVEINGKTVDLHTSNFSNYYEELDMRSGLLTRSYTVDSVKLTFRRFFSIVERRTAEFQLIIEGKAKVIKNTGQLPMYLIQNNHPAIVSREIYQAVQAEKTRRSASASPSKKMSSTGRSCYASKFAPSERLVCGECGTLYRRCTWKRNGKARVVWRCVSRLDYGTKYCHQSPTMDEEPLQQAIMAAINSVMDSKGAICSQITEAAVEETGILPDSAMTLGEIDRRLEELETEFNILLQQPDSAVKNAARFGGIANEIASLKGQREKIAARLRKDQTVQLHVHTMEAALDGMSHLMQQWDEEMIRQLVHTVKVISIDRIKVYLYDGMEIEQTVNP